MTRLSVVTGTGYLLTAEGVVSLDAAITESATPTLDGEPWEVLVEYQGLSLDLAGNRGTWIDHDIYVVDYHAPS